MSRNTYFKLCESHVSSKDDLDQNLLLYTFQGILIHKRRYYKLVAAFPNSNEDERYHLKYIRVVMLHIVFKIRAHSPSI